MDQHTYNIRKWHNKFLIEEHEKAIEWHNKQIKRINKRLTKLEIKYYGEKKHGKKQKRST